MTEIEEVAVAIQTKYPMLWPMTAYQASYIAQQEAGDQGDTIVNLLADALLKLNDDQERQRLDSLPTVIDGPGEYLCRDGRRALIHSTNGSIGTFSCRGARYRMFRGQERARGLFIWHPSGRYYAVEESPYDIVAKAPEEAGNE